MEVADELFDYIPDVPEDNFLEISQFILLPSVDGEEPHFVTDTNNNNDEVDENNYRNNSQETIFNGSVSFGTDSNSEKMVDDKSMEGTDFNSPAHSVKAKRGRPPSKPPTKEVVRKRRKAANARERRRMDRMNEAFHR